MLSKCGHGEECENQLDGRRVGNDWRRKSSDAHTENKTKEMDWTHKDQRRLAAKNGHQMKNGEKANRRKPGPITLDWMITDGYGKRPKNDRSDNIGHA